MNITDEELCILSRVWHASNKGGADNWQEQRISDFLQEFIIAKRAERKPRANPCPDCVNGFCDMNCGPAVQVGK